LGWGIFNRNYGEFSSGIDKKEWWAKIKLKSGQTGWVNMDTAEFGGVDVLG